MAKSATYQRWKSAINNVRKNKFSFLHINSSRGWLKEAKWLIQQSIKRKSIKTQTHNQNIEKIDRYYLDGLKEENAKTESVCTRSRRKLLGLMELELPSRKLIRYALQDIDMTQQEILDLMGKMIDKY